MVVRPKIFRFSLTGTPPPYKSRKFRENDTAHFREKKSEILTKIYFFGVRGISHSRKIQNRCASSPLPVVQIWSRSVDVWVYSIVSSFGIGRLYSLICITCSKDVVKWREPETFWRHCFITTKLATVEKKFKRLSISAFELSNFADQATIGLWRFLLSRRACNFATVLAMQTKLGTIVELIR